MNDITFVGLDVHKATIAVAVAEGSRHGEVRNLGVFQNRADVMAKLVERLTKAGRRLSFCYEAGPCGYGLHRFLIGRGHPCIVVAPSLIPMKAGRSTPFLTTPSERVRCAQLISCTQDGVQNCRYAYSKDRNCEDVSSHRAERRGRQNHHRR